MIYVKGIPGRTTEVDGYSYLFFSGFAYLGMPSLPEFQNLVVEGIQKYGAVFPSSRCSNTRNAMYDEFEKALSGFVGLPASASFSSGYLAAQAALEFAASGGHLYALEGIHPSLKIKTKNSFSGTVSFIIEQVNQSEYPGTIVLESVNPLTGQVADFDWLLQIKRPVRVIVDDSHGIGLLGENGSGIAAHLPRADHLRYLICYSLSKAFSCEGGAISGEREDIDRIKNRPPFSAATPMSPAFLYAWMNSNELFESQLKKLKRNMLYFADAIRKIETIAFDHRLPVFRFSNEMLYEKALKYHVLLSAFRYPTEKNPLMVRAVLNALHTTEDLDRLAHCITLIND